MVDHLEVMDARPPGRHQHPCHCGGHYRCGTAGGAGSHSLQASIGARAAAVATSTVGQVGTSTRATAVATIAVDQLVAVARPATRQAPVHGPLSWPPPLWTSSWRWYARPPGRHQLAGHCGGHYRCGTAGGAGSHSHQAGTGARAAELATTAVDQLVAVVRPATRSAPARGPLRWPLPLWNSWRCWIAQPPGQHRRAGRCGGRHGHSRGPAEHHGPVLPRWPPAWWTTWR